MKNQDKINLVSVIVFLFLIYLTLLQSIFHFLPEQALGGVSEKAVRPVINFKDWLSGDLQKNMEAWIDQSLGFRSYLIKSDNQLNYLLFHESHQKTGSKIIIGRENYLYEESYIKSYLGRDSQSIKSLEDKVKKLKTLQELLKSKGIELIFLISPSKAYFYSEYLPTELIYETSEKNQETNYEKIKPLLNQFEINYIDGHKMFSDMKNNSKYPLFSKSGVHWTRYGACLMTKKILSDYGSKKQINLSIPNCDSVELNPIPQGEDGDLAKLLNIWTPDIFFQTLAYPNYHNEYLKSNNLNVMIVGDSFVWGILRTIEGARLTNDYNFYYYFKTDYGHYLPNKKIDQKNTPLLKEELLKRNLVLIEINEAGLSTLGFEFLDASIKALSE